MIKIFKSFILFVLLSSILTKVALNFSPTTSFIKTSPTTTIRVFPMPKEVSYGQDTYYLYPSFQFSTSSKSLILISAINRYKDLIFDQQVNNNLLMNNTILKEIKIQVVSDDETLQLGTDESYSLNITPSQLTLSSNTIYGAIRGLESFSQLVEYNFDLEYYYINNGPWNINDEPRFPHRGTLLDTSRHYISVPVLLRFIDSLSYAKFNVFHWHIVDAQSFPMQSKVYPNLWKGAWSKRQVYTQNDIKQVIQYAKERGIRVVVEIDMPGHAYSWGVGYPDVLPSNYSLSDKCNQPCPQDSLCNVPLDLSSQLSYDISTGLINEMSQLFPDKFMHVGGDEVQTACWDNSITIKKWMSDKGITSYDQLLMNFEQTIHQTVLKVDKIPVVWEETFLLFGDQLNRQVVVQIYHQLSTLQNAIKAGHYGIASNAWSWYLDLNKSWEDFYTNDIAANITKPEEISRLLGGETCMWGEVMDSSNLFEKVWPRNAAAAERLWSPAEFNDVNEVKSRLQRFRCHMIFRGVESAPLYSSTPVTPNPTNPGSCYDQ